MRLSEDYQIKPAELNQTRNHDSGHCPEYYGSLAPGAHSVAKNFSNSEPETPAPALLTSWLTPPDSHHLQNRSSAGNSSDGPGHHGFNIFDAFLADIDLLTNLIRQLEIDDMVALYAISRDFHELVDQNLTSFIMAHAETHAPESTEVFRFKAYKSLCKRDPGDREHPVIPGEIRYVPTFRWLRMILYRERIVDEIIAALATEAHLMPLRASKTIKKIWLTMGVGLNSYRIGLMHNEDFWTDDDLCMATLFFIKLDMRFLDPIDGRGQTKLRRLLNGQRSLTTLWEVLTGRLNSRLGALQLMVRYEWVPSPEHRHLPILGVPPDQVGIGCRERTGPEPDIRKRPKLMRVDQLVMREALRRKIDMEKDYLDMITWGYCDWNAILAERKLLNMGDQWQQQDSQDSEL